MLAAFCVANALRRNSQDLVAGPLGAFAFEISVHTATTLALATIVAVAVMTSYQRITPRSRWHYPALVGAVLLSSLIGVTFILATDARFMPGPNPAWGWPEVMAMWPRYALLSALLTAVYVLFKRAEHTRAEANRADEERLSMEQRMDEARLSVLQAQIEPHFLFNTLATVRRLYEIDHSAAVRMLDNLMRYLTTALPQMRSGHSTLGREIALTAAYLDIQRIRMGERLTFSIETDPGLASADMPPMMILTLAENAIKHGLGALNQGGILRIRARQADSRLTVEVADTGQGFMPRVGGGTGLANIAARLAAAYGERAQLLLSSNRPSGVIATITLPLSTSQESIA